jgi:hypothetical protein
MLDAKDVGYESEYKQLSSGANKQGSVAIGDAGGKMDVDMDVNVADGERA